jgi:aminotransferase
MAYGVAVAAPTRAEDNFALMASEVESRITPRTRVLVLNFPTNPTGAIQPDAEMEKIAALCVKHDIIVVTDEIYSELRYENAAKHRSILTYPGMRERGILLHGFSKAFAMTGFRLGYACAPPELTEAMMKIHQYCMLCAPMPSQMAAIEALEHGEASVQEMRDAYEKRRNLTVTRFNEIGLRCFEPGGAFYAFPDVTSTGLSGREFAIRLLEEEDVAVVPGNAFGPSGEGFVRCCYATDPELLGTALERIEAFVNRVRKSKL